MPNTLLTAERGAQSDTPAPEIVEPSIASSGVSTPDIAMADSTEFAQDAEKVFTYAHGDGQEFSGTLDQARKICPVIGRMSVEKAVATLQDGDLAARIAQRGREKRQAESAKVSEAKERSQVPTDDKKLQNKPAVEAERPSETVIESENGNQTKNIIRGLALGSSVQHNFLAQQEASKAGKSQKVESIEESAKSVVKKEIPRNTTVKEVEPVYHSAKAQEVFEVARESEEVVIDVVHEVVPQSPDVQLYESIEAQLEPAVVLRNMMEVAEPTEMSESLIGYDLLEDDDVILLMAGLEQSSTEIEENGELPLPEIIADTTETEVFKVTPAEIQNVESVPELPAPVKEVEVAITGLVEALESAEADESQEVYQILEEIITLPDTLEASTVEADAAVEEKLEALFIRLFEETGTLYTPELVESFVKLTQAHYLKELLLIAIEAEDDTGALPHEIGTREFLQKLHHGLSAMKQAVFHCYEIGKSVLRVYGLAGAVPEFARAAD